MINRLKSYLKSDYDTLNKIEISRAKLLANLEYLASLQPGAAIWPVLKANAYGHGIKEVAQILSKSLAPVVIVDSFPEAQIVYDNFSGEVLISGEMSLDVYKYLKWRKTMVVVYNLKTIKYLAQNFPGARVHLFYNSGLNREGFDDPAEFMKMAQQYLQKLAVVGFMSHLTSAEEDGPENARQLAKFWSALEIIKSYGYQPEFIHIGNSAGLFTISDQRLNVWRTGLSFYGYSLLDSTNINFPKVQKLQPALRVLSTVIAKHQIASGEGVSYNHRYRADTATSIAVMPFGYFEGLPRDLSKLAKFKINNELVEIAGTICMNLCCLDTRELKCKVGDRVEIISSNKADFNSLDNLAKISQKIPYELLTNLKNNIRREVV